MKNRFKILLCSMFICLCAGKSFGQGKMWLWDYVIREDGKKKTKGYDEEIHYISNDTLYRYMLNKREKILNDWSDFSIIKKVGEEHFLYRPENEYSKEHPLHLVFKYLNDTTMVLKSEHNELQSFYRLVKPTKTKMNIRQINDFFHKNQFKTNLSYLDKKYSDKIHTISFLIPFSKPKSDSEIPAFIISQENYHFIFHAKARKTILPITHFNKKGFSVENRGSKKKELSFIKTKKKEK